MTNNKDRLLKYIQKLDILWNLKIDLMSLILGKYKNKRKLGKGGYGQVLLVQDPQGRQFALKKICMKSLRKEPYLLDYLEGEIECMRSIKSPYILSLIDSQEDENYKYMLCQYCEGGDLSNLQMKQPGQVFTLARATEILSDVIIGLELLHKQDYLHRDIKLQNILIKYQNERQIFKLADFGFSKKSGDIFGTTLGTERYMSPEIYRQDNYGFEVDMWAFGVLFFFMLNREYPFEINPQSQNLQTKQIQLTNLAKNFSFRKAVEKTQKKIIKNCTAETEDLFKRIFHLDAQKRINFHDIRKHPIFSKYFPLIDQDSAFLYSKKFQSKIAALSKRQDKKTNFKKERATIQNMIAQISFLYDSGIQFLDSNLLQSAQKMSLGYNIVKYYIILMRKIIVNLNAEWLSVQYPNCKWKDYCKSIQFQNIKSIVKENLLKAEKKFDFLYSECKNLIDQIVQLNSKFKADFSRDFKDQDFKGAFKQSYRRSTHLSFNNLREFLKSSKQSSNRINYAICILVICHVFNHIFSDASNMETIFAAHLKEKKKTAENLDYKQLREWLSKAEGPKLSQITKNIIKIYF